MTVVRTTIPVLGDGSAKLAHGEHHHIGHAVAQVQGKRAKRVPKISEARCELALVGALVHMCIPTADVRECDFETEVCANELCDLSQRVPEWALGLLGGVGWFGPCGIDRLQHANGLKRLFRRGCDQTGCRGLVQILEGARQPIG